MIYNKKYLKGLELKIKDISFPAKTFLFLNMYFKQAIIAQSEAYKEAVFSDEKIREKLPVFKSPDEKVNVWAVIKDCIGKDLTKFSVPGNTKKNI